MAILNKGYEIKDGKVIHNPKPRDASHAIRRNKSKKQRPVSQAKLSVIKAQRP